MSTHGPKLREISRHARPTSSPMAGAKTSSSYRRGTSAHSKANSQHSGTKHAVSSAPMPHARIPGQLLSVAETSRINGPERPYTAGATVQSTPRKTPADSLMQSLAEHSSPRRRVRCATCMILPQSPRRGCFASGMLTGRLPDARVFFLASGMLTGRLPDARVFFFSNTRYTSARERYRSRCVIA